MTTTHDEPARRRFPEPSSAWRLHDLGEPRFAAAFASRLPGSYPAES